MLLRIDNGRLVAQERLGRPAGTTMSVEHLFARVPARLKFLKSIQTERGHIDGIVMRYAMAYPHIRFTLTHDNRRTFQSLGNGNLRDVLIEVYGTEAAEKMVPIGDDSGSCRLSSVIRRPSPSPSAASSPCPNTTTPTGAGSPCSSTAVRCRTFGWPTLSSRLTTRC